MICRKMYCFSNLYVSGQAKNNQDFSHQVLLVSYLHWGKFAEIVSCTTWRKPVAEQDQTWFRPLQDTPAISRRVTSRVTSFLRTSSLHPWSLNACCSSHPGEDCLTQSHLCGGCLQIVLSYYSTLLSIRPQQAFQLEHSSVTLLLKAATQQRCHHSLCVLLRGTRSSTSVAKCTETHGRWGWDVPPLALALHWSPCWLGRTALMQKTACIDAILSGPCHPRAASQLTSQTPPADKAP